MPASCPSRGIVASRHWRGMEAMLMAGTTWQVLDPRIQPGAAA